MLVTITSLNSYTLVWHGLHPVFFEWIAPEGHPWATQLFGHKIPSELPQLTWIKLTINWACTLLRLGPTWAVTSDSLRKCQSENFMCKHYFSTIFQSLQLAKLEDWDYKANIFPTIFYLTKKEADNVKTMFTNLEQITRSIIFHVKNWIMGYLRTKKVVLVQPWIMQSQYLS